MQFSQHEILYTNQWPIELVYSYKEVSNRKW